nr:unnamed protein product [Digitaria exilis]
MTNQKRNKHGEQQFLDLHGLHAFRIAASLLHRARSHLLHRAGLLLHGQLLEEMGMADLRRQLLHCAGLLLQARRGGGYGGPATPSPPPCRERERWGRPSAPVLVLSRPRCSSHFTSPRPLDPHGSGEVEQQSRWSRSCAARQWRAGARCRSR